MSVFLTRPSTLFQRLRESPPPILSVSVLLSSRCCCFPTAPHPTAQNIEVRRPHYPACSLQLCRHCRDRYRRLSQHFVPCASPLLFHVDAFMTFHDRKALLGGGLVASLCTLHTARACDVHSAFRSKLRARRVRVRELCNQWCCSKRLASVRPPPSQWPITKRIQAEQGYTYFQATVAPQSTSHPPSPGVPSLDALCTGCPGPTNVATRRLHNAPPPHVRGIAPSIARPRPRTTGN